MSSNNTSSSKAREINVLHIYSDAMDLYGDYFNIVCIKKALEERFGMTCNVDKVGIDEDIKPADYDMVYIGHGKARNLNAVSEHFIKYADKINQAVENNTLFLVTGNARLLFGREFTTADGETKQGSGLFDYVGYDTGKVFTSDVVGRISDDESNGGFLTYGFINRTHYIVHDGGENSHPLFEVLIGAGDSLDGDGTEGTLYKNFIGTWQMGPLLARNPHILELLLKRLLGGDYREPEQEDGVCVEQEALDLTLAEFDLPE